MYLRTLFLIVIINQRKLIFRLQIENLFCLGSPLSVFLALRTRTPSNRLDVMPQSLCKRFYNIFHWSDPVAYRMEPLLERGYSKIEPVLIPPYGGVDGQQIPQSPSSLNNVDPTLPSTGILFIMLLLFCLRFRLRSDIYCQY